MSERWQDRLGDALATTGRFAWGAVEIGKGIGLFVNPEGEARRAARRHDPIAAQNAKNVIFVRKGTRWEISPQKEARIRRLIEKAREKPAE